MHAGVRAYRRARQHWLRLSSHGNHNVNKYEGFWVHAGVRAYERARQHWLEITFIQEPRSQEILSILGAWFGVGAYKRARQYRICITFMWEPKCREIRRMLGACVCRDILKGATTSATKVDLYEN